MDEQRQEPAAPDPAAEGVPGPAAEGVPGPALDPAAEGVPGPASEVGAEPAAEQDAERVAEPDPRLTPDPDPFYEPWRDRGRNYAATSPPTSHSGPALEVERRVLGVSRLIDRLQSRFTPVAFGYAVFKKYADDEGSRLAALLAYYSFLSIFPLLIGGLAILNSVLADRPDLVADLADSIVPEPYQEQVIASYESVPSSGPAFAIAVVGLLLSGTAGVFSLYGMVNQVFAIPYRFRFGFGPRYARVLLLVLLMGVGTLVVAVGSSLLATVGGIPGVQRLGGFLIVWLVAAGLLYTGASVLTRRALGFRVVGLGAVLGGLAATVVLSLGSVLVGRFVTTSTPVYGVFGTVVAIFSVLFLTSNAIVFSFEISAVRAWQLWPRGVDINLLFPADERAYALLTLMDERMPVQRNGIAFDATGHDDPRRPDPATLQHRPPGIPRRPYDTA